MSYNNGGLSNLFRKFSKFRWKYVGAHCSASFHQNCLNLWTKEKNTCPHCRSEITFGQQNKEYKVPIEAHNKAQNKEAIEITNNTDNTDNTVNHANNKYDGVGLLVGW